MCVAIGERIAKAIARTSNYSRRQVEGLIEQGLVKVDGKVIRSPALNVTANVNTVELNGKMINLSKQATEVFKYYKTLRQLCTAHGTDPMRRKTVFDTLPMSMHGLMTVGRLDYNTEGLLLLTNDGDLKRTLELPRNQYMRTYSVRIKGRMDPSVVAELKVNGRDLFTMTELIFESPLLLQHFQEGLVADGGKTRYQPIAAEVIDESRNTSYSWVQVALTEGKNREVRKVFEHFNLHVTQLKRLSFGPFYLGDLQPGVYEKVEMPRELMSTSEKRTKGV
jgi:23S rRNA pseudouridine2605 synthase